LKARSEDLSKTDINQASLRKLWKQRKWIRGKRIWENFCFSCKELFHSVTQTTFSSTSITTSSNYTWAYLTTL